MKTWFRPTETAAATGGGLSDTPQASFHIPLHARLIFLSSSFLLHSFPSSCTWEKCSISSLTASSLYRVFMGPHKHVLIFNAALSRAGLRGPFFCETKNDINNKGAVNLHAASCCWEATWASCERRFPLNTLQDAFLWTTGNIYCIKWSQINNNDVKPHVGDLLLIWGSAGLVFSF